MLTRDEKAAIVQELKDRLGRQQVSIFANIRGVPVAGLSKFRRELKAAGAELKVAKKTLLGRALSSLGIGIKPQELEGEIGVIFGYQDQVSPAKALAAFAKAHKGVRVLKGILAGRILESSEVMALARLPNREELLGALARALTAPFQGLLNVLQGNLRNLVAVLDQVKSKK